MHRAILDFIGLPAHAPGNLEGRLQYASFREDGSYIDDGSRPQMLSREQPMRNLHRILLGRGQNMKRCFANAARFAEEQGYDRPDFSMARHVARHEWRESVITASRNRLKVKHPTRRIAVRALGFDIVGKGQLSVGLSRILVRPDGVSVNAKASVLLQPGDSIDLFMEAVDMLAAETDYEGLCEEDRSLLLHVSAKLWTSAVVARREDEWAQVDGQNTACGMSPLETRQIEFVQRLGVLNVWAPCAGRNEVAFWSTRSKSSFDLV